MTTTYTVLAIQFAMLAAGYYWFALALRQADRAGTHADSAFEELLRIKSERDRVTTLERELNALRLELRKLAGKFYAAQREQEETQTEIENDKHVQTFSAPICANYERAQQEGPKSPAAACDCNYCKGRRASKEQFRERQRAAGHLNPQWVRDHSTGTGNNGD